MCITFSTFSKDILCILGSLGRTYISYLKAVASAIMNMQKTEGIQRVRCRSSPRNKHDARNSSVVTRATSSALLGCTTTKRKRTPSRLLLESLESEDAIQHDGQTDETSSFNKTLADKPKPKRSGSAHKAPNRSDIAYEKINCCLCNVSIDYSDKDLFLPKDALASDQVIEGKLPYELYDPQNGILICDYPGCCRSYHQRCHFVPVLSIPKGHWYCLLCKLKSHDKNLVSRSLKNNYPSNYVKLESLLVPLSPEDFDGLYPPKFSQVQEAEPLTHLRFEFQSAPIKAHLLHQELSSRLKSTIHRQLLHIRRAKDTIRTYTTMKSVLKTLVDDYVKSSTLPQEFIQSVLLMTRSKMKIRQIFMSLQKLVHNFDEVSILTSVQCNSKNILVDTSEHNKRRREPRFDIKDYDADEEDSQQVDNKDPSEKIKCCICFSGHVGEEENDVLMCDGQDCMRAFHMKCMTPHVTQKMLDDDIEGTWFCPYCTAFANFIHDTRMEYIGDDHMKNKHAKDDSWDNISDGTWDDADDVFSEAPFEMNAAETWLTKYRTTESDRYLSSLLGMNLPVSTFNNAIDATSKPSNGGTRELSRNRSTNSTGSDDSSQSVHNHHEDMVLESIDVSNIIKGKRSRVKVDYKRLNESLSEYASDDDSEDKVVANESVDVSNIITGKRTRPKIDYMRLNDTLLCYESEDNSTNNF